MVGIKADLGQRPVIQRALRSCLTAQDAGHRFPAHEVAQGYKDVKERSAIARFKVKGEDAYFLAWTTTPWTLAIQRGSVCKS